MVKVELLIYVRCGRWSSNNAESSDPEKEMNLQVGLKLL